jgi:type VI protein secretion system component VasK
MDVRDSSHNHRVANKEARITMGGAIVLVLVFYLTWLILLAWAVCQRAMREAESKQRARERENKRDE